MKLNCTNELISGVLLTDISDHMPIFNFIGKRQSPITNHKYVTCDDTALYKIVNNLKSLNSTLLLHNMNINDASDFFIRKITEVIDIYAPEKSMAIKQKDIIRQPWMTPALIKSTNTKDKMYRRCVGKSKDCLASVNFIKYRNIYNKIAKQEFYAEKLFEYKNDVKKTNV